MKAKRIVLAIILITGCGQISPPTVQVAARSIPASPPPSSSPLMAPSPPRVTPLLPLNNLFQQQKSIRQATRTGQVRVLLARLEYPNGAGPTLATHTIAQQKAQAVQTQFDSNAAGRARFMVDVTQSVMMPQHESAYSYGNLGEWITDTERAVRIQTSFDPDYYHSVLILSVRTWSSCCPNGMVFTPRYAGYAGRSVYVMAHEIGHSLMRLAHANFLDAQFPATNPIIEYGNRWAIMGDSYSGIQTKRDFGPSARERSGWIREGLDYVTITSTPAGGREFFIAPLDSGTEGLTALRIPRTHSTGDAQDLWVYQRNAPRSRSGLSLDLSGYHSFDPTVLLDMNRGVVQPEWLDHQLVQGQSFYDVANDIHLRATQVIPGVLSKVWVRLGANYQLPDFPAVINFVQPGPGDLGKVLQGTKEFQVTAYDPEVGTNNWDGVDHVQFTIRQPQSPQIFGTFRMNHPRDVWSFDSTTVPNANYVFTMQVRRHGGIELGQERVKLSVYNPPRP